MQLALPKATHWPLDGEHAVQTQLAMEKSLETRLTLDS